MDAPAGWEEIFTIRDCLLDKYVKFEAPIDGTMDTTAWDGTFDIFRSLVSSEPMQ